MKPPKKCRCTRLGCQKNHIRHAEVDAGSFEKLRHPCVVCGCWEGVNQQTLYCPYHTNHDLDGTIHLNP
jgi:hypothetical protein